ncbi:hypothetical protein C8R45DRAFT_580712 [Mycena sanguinolenta]|nr:hypothetical protein C8R45DRAFT_580712 [Mycena sanguinolenta]
MDSETQPLLTDTEANDNIGHSEHSHPTPSPQAEHLCARCSAQREPRNDKGGKITWRLVLLLLAIFFSVTMFNLVVAHMAVAGSASVVGVIVTLWTTSTIVVLGLLLYAGRRPGHKLGRTAVQVYVLCALALTWICTQKQLPWNLPHLRVVWPPVLIVGVITQNVQECTWTRWGIHRASCALITSADVLTWFLVTTLFAAAYATYRRALAMHGKGTTTVSVPVPTWCLASVGDVEGAIKI